VLPHGESLGPLLAVATLLWRRAVRAADVEPSRRTFFRLGLLATPAALPLSTVMLWLTLRVTG
jgi:Na+/H+ antiporter NhaD/arsenite permease-like protein